MSLHPNPSLATRPTFHRQITDNSRIELSTVPQRPSLSRSNSSMLPQDVYEQMPLNADAALRPTVRERLTERLRGPAAVVPQPVRSVVSRTVDVMSANWRDLTLAGVLTGLVSWAIWATTKIRENDIPYCVFDDPRNP